MAGRRRDYGGLSRDEERAAQFALNSFLRLNRQAQIGVVVLLLIVGAFFAITYYRAHHPSAGDPVASVSPHMLLGNPSSATTSPFNQDNYLMPRPYFALSYNDSMGRPNWVSWRMLITDLGDAPRKDDFDPDDSLPPGYYRVTQRDYTGSGFDRGHMCPHGDRSANTDLSFATFVMTNIVPQAPNQNRKAWAQLEMYCRELVSRQHERLYITSGPAGRGGRGNLGYRDTIAGGRVTVPADCWKVVVVIPEEGGEDDLAKITADTRVIAVDMPNDQEAIDEQWAGFRTSVAEIERHTGYHFFDRLSSAIAQSLKVKVDRTYVPPPRPLTHGRD